jgi:hypothetical protein
MFDEHIVRYFHHVLTYSFFRFNGQIYEQVNGVVMCSPLSPVIVELFIEDFAEEALNGADYRHLCWFQYVDDTSVVWPHGSEKLYELLNHLNSTKRNIQFSVVTESNGHLPFLAIDIRRRLGGSLGHTVYRKPSHTHPHTHTHTHTQTSIWMPNRTTIRDTNLCDQQNFLRELNFVRSTFKQNGCNDRSIGLPMRLRRKTNIEKILLP